MVNGTSADVALPQGVTATTRAKKVPWIPTYLRNGRGGYRFARLGAAREAAPLHLIAQRPGNRRPMQGHVSALNDRATVGADGETHGARLGTTTCTSLENSPKIAHCRRSRVPAPEYWPSGTSGRRPAGNRCRQRLRKKVGRSRAGTYDEMVPCASGSGVHCKETVLLTTFTADWGWSCRRDAVRGEDGRERERARACRLG